jgi:eukaryotic-like serine/threonine-protein kinase
MSEASSVPSFKYGATLAGKYVLEDRIGAGGMGEIYAARNDVTGARVAVKIMRGDTGRNEKAVRRFLREGRVAAKLESRHVTRVYEFGVSKDDGVLFCVFELLQGIDFAELITRDGPAPIALCVDRMMEALAGVAEAHVNGIVHRDLKPGNLFLVDDGSEGEIVKVLDFGIAKILQGGELVHGALTSTTALVGSPLYMSPEQLKSSKNVDVRADIWSLGVVLYEMTTGDVPFMGSSLGTLLKAVLEGRPTPAAERRPEIPAPLSAAIMRCLAHDADARFATVHELASAIAPFGTNRSGLALQEIEMHFGSETGQAAAADSSPSVPSLPALAVTELADAPPSKESAARLATTAARSTGGPRSSSLVALGIALLVLTFAVGFYFAGR